MLQIVLDIVMSVLEELGICLVESIKLLSYILDGYSKEITNS